MNHKFTNKDLKENIRSTLGMEGTKRLDESYVIQKKQFDLPTELLSQANKNNHIEL